MSAMHGGGAEKVLVDFLRNFDDAIFDIELCLIVKSGVHLNKVPDYVKIKALYNSNLLYRIEGRISRIFNTDLFIGNNATTTCICLPKISLTTTILATVCFADLRCF